MGFAGGSAEQRKDNNRGFPARSPALLLCAASTLACAICVFVLFWQRDATGSIPVWVVWLGDVLSVAIIGLVVAFHLRAPLPDAFKAAMCGAAVGALMGKLFAAGIGARTQWAHPAPSERAVATGAVLGAAAGVAAFFFRFHDRLAARPLAGM